MLRCCIAGWSARDRLHERNQQEPDLLCEVFVLAPTDLLDEAAMEAAGIEPARPEQTGVERR